MKCPQQSCDKVLDKDSINTVRERGIDPRWKLGHSLVVLIIIVVWMLPYISKWDTEPWMVGGMYVTIIAYAFRGEAVEIAKGFFNRE